MREANDLVTMSTDRHSNALSSSDSIKKSEPKVACNN
jgi:hypothetical protein